MNFTNFINSKVIILALGGSVVHPKEGIDVSLLRRFRALVEKHLRRGTKFVLVIGGGALCREFLAAARAVRPLSNTEQDWLGIHTTWPNAELVRLVFGKYAAPKLITSETAVPSRLKYSVTVSGGWRPGWSTDYVAVRVANILGSKAALIAGKPAFVYDKDPDKFKDAKPQKEMTWAKYRKIIPKTWQAGSHAPVDPMAAALAAKKDLTCVVLDGKNLKNLDSLLSGKNFQGTVIKG